MRFAASVFSLLIIISLLFTVSSSAISDNAFWEDGETYTLCSDNESNCSLSYAFAKIKYDYPSNRIRILFMMVFDSFSDEKNTGVEISFNDLDYILITADGTVEYDNSVYYAELIDCVADKNSKAVQLEAVIGIKSGIPDELIMNTTVFDTEGVSSNEFSTDITPGKEDEETTVKTDSEKTSKTKKQNTSKTKTTKVKTTNIKTTKTTKAKKSTVSKTTANNKKINATVNNEQMDSRITTASDSKKSIAFISIGLAVCFTLCGCIIGVKKSNKTGH